MFFMSFRKVHSKYFVLSMSTGIHEVDPEDYGSNKENNCILGKRRFKKTICSGFMNPRKEEGGERVFSPSSIEIKDFWMAEGIRP
jgi:hypothetical protein